MKKRYECKKEKVVLDVEVIYSGKSSVMAVIFMFSLYTSHRQLGSRCRGSGRNHLYVILDCHLRYVQNRISFLMTLCSSLF